MKRYYYDLHVHSCLSPCGDDDNTPNNIAGMAALSEIDIMALTDHNTADNCPAFFAAAERCGITAVAGMELTTSEEIHVVCLFEHLEDAMRFSDEVKRHRTMIPNRTDIFGRQLIMNADDEIISEDEHLLTVATDISIEDLPALVNEFGGICYPAHIDKDANGIIAILGTVPDQPYFRAVELHDPKKLENYKNDYRLHDRVFVFSSDAHYLESIEDKTNYFVLDTVSSDHDEIRNALFRYLKGEK